MKDLDTGEVIAGDSEKHQMACNDTVLKMRVRKRNRVACRTRIVLRMKGKLLGNINFCY
jgi:hypothetical protein